MITIFCFSSTGNSLYAAKVLAGKTCGRVVSMNNAALTCEDDVIGFVFPVYFWGLPRMVEHFATTLKITNKDAYVFAVATSGGPSFGVLGAMKKLLQSHGVSLAYGARLVSVSNYLPEYEAQDSEKIRRRIDVRIAKIADAVNSRRSNWVLAPTFLNRRAHRAYPDASCDRHFVVASACNGCTTCEKVCPAHNIVMNAGKPEFQHRCEHCLGCVHSCPVQALDWKQATQGKRRYRNAGVSLSDLISANSEG